MTDTFDGYPLDEPPVDDWAESVDPSETPERREARRLAEVTRFELRRLRAQQLAREQLAAEQAERLKRETGEAGKVVTGAAFLLDLPAETPAIWGKGDDILWAKGESLIIAGPQGVGKTTVAGQILRGLAGLQPEVLGFPVTPTPQRRVGYLAMDRPEQARRALGRMFSEAERAFIDEVLRFWKGPLPVDAAVDPDTFVRAANQMDSEVLIVDSMKDAAIGLAKDEVGAGYNRARQKALAEGIELLELHHVVKNGVDGKAPKNLAGVYGSTWLTSGAGSIIMLWGEAGDPIVEFSHLKQPMNEVGPFKIRHNRETGLSEVFHDEDTDVVAKARQASGTGLTAKEAAQCMFGVETPTPSQTEKARRRLARHVADGLLVERSSPSNGRGSQTLWFPVAPTGWGEAPADLEAA